MTRPELRMRVRTMPDGDVTEIRQVRCPLCGTWGDLDNDQYHGRVSMVCGNDGCTYHETHDLSRLP